MTNLDLKSDCNKGYFELVTQLHQCEVCGLDSAPVAVLRKKNSVQTAKITKTLSGKIRNRDSQSSVLLNVTNIWRNIFATKSNSFTEPHTEQIHHSCIKNGNETRLFVIAHFLSFFLK